jgi:hypothetical protein
MPGNGGDGTIEGEGEGGDDEGGVADLYPDGQGGYWGDTPNFLAHINADGSLGFEDKGSQNNWSACFHHSPVPPKDGPPIGAGIARYLTDWYNDPEHFSGSGELSRLVGGSVQPMCLPLPILFGTFDLTDTVMRLHGDDPYLSQKRDFAAKTLVFRDGLAMQYDHDLLQRSVLDVPARLTALWNDPTIDAPTRRLRLFNLWDSCAEEGDADTVAAADKVREEILQFIHEHLPEDSADAYTTAELASLNAARTSHAVFAPYP